VYCLAARTSIGPHLDEAEMLAADGFRLGQLAGHSDSLEFYATQMLHIRTVQGRAEELVDLIYQTAQERPVGLPAWQSGQLVTYWEAERADLARPIFEQLSTTSFSFPRDVVWLQATASIGPIVARMGSLEDAQVLFDLLLPFEDRIAGTSVAWNGPVAHALGVLASRLGRTEQAAEFFTKAEELIQRTDAPYWLALNQLERARAGCDEPVEQIRLVSAARQWAESAGAARLAKEAATVEADARALAGPGSG
jgi:tetratricopeptide (TPR) repeat protein